MLRQLGLSSLILLIFPQLSLAAPIVRNLGANPAEARVLQALGAKFNLEAFAEVRMKPVKSAAGAIDHVVIYLLEKKYHRLDLASADLDSAGRVTKLNTAYKLRAMDRKVLRAPHCPDDKVEFIAFAPNEDSLEQQVTVDVATAAKAQGLSTVSLLLDRAGGGREAL